MMTDKEAKRAYDAMVHEARKTASRWFKAQGTLLSAEYDAATERESVWEASRKYMRASGDLTRRFEEWNDLITRHAIHNGTAEDFRAVRERITGYHSETTPTPKVEDTTPTRAPTSTRRRRRALTGKRVDWNNRRPPEEARVWEQHPLEPDETIVMHVRRAAFWYVFPWLVIISLGGVTYATGAIFAVGALITWWWIYQDRYLITDKRIIARVGVFDKDAIIIRLDRVQDVVVHRPLLASFFNNGFVSISTAGGPTRELVIRNQDDPDKVANAIRGGPRR